MALHKKNLGSLHSLACFWACEDSLWHRHNKSQITRFCVSILGILEVQWSFTIITRAIRHHLYKYLRKNEKSVFSSKSLCIVSITKIAARRGVDFFKIHARSGHSIGTNQESYLDQNSLALTLPGMYALNGWVDVTSNKAYLMFHCLGLCMTETFHCLIKEFFIVSVPPFNRDDSLYPILLSAIDILVMYHCSVRTRIVYENCVYTSCVIVPKNPKSRISTVLGTSH